MTEQTTSDATEVDNASSTADENNTEVGEGNTENTENPAEPPKSDEELLAELLSKVGIKHKVNGQEREFKSLEDLRKYAGLGLSATERFEEAARLRKEAEEKLAALESKNKDPKQILKENFESPDALNDFLANFIEEQLAEAELTPEQKRLRELEAKEAERELRAKEEKEKAELEAQERAVEAEVKKVYQEIGEAFEKHGLPEEPEIYKSVIEEMRIANSHGVELSADEAVKLVNQQRQETLHGLVSSLDVDAILELIGEEGIKKVRARDIESIKSKEQTFDTPKQESKQPEQKTEQPKRKVVDLSTKNRYRSLAK